MRKFKDERYPEKIITEKQLKFDYVINFGDPSENPYLNFEDYIKACLDKNGTLTEIKENNI